MTEEQKQQEDAKDPVKIRVPLSDEYEAESETFWAIPLGDALYEIQNVPMLAEGLHVLDVVRCDEEPGHLPIVREVVRPSGYRTIGIMFADEASQDERVDVLYDLAKLRVMGERATESIFYMAIAPDVDIVAICDYLDTKANQGLLAYEELE
jgi:hypothetical protein